MNMQSQIQDFGYQDFILVQSPSIPVLEALRAILNERDHGPKVEKPAAPKGIVKRAMSILKRSKPEPAEKSEPMELPEVLQSTTLLDGIDPFEVHLPPFQLYRGDAADHAGLIMTTEQSIPNPAEAIVPRRSFNDDIRVSMLRAAPDWCLIEFREDVSDICALAEALSRMIDEAEVLYFRRSGDIAVDVHFDFHVYADGDTMRRVACRSTWPEDDMGDEAWTGIAEGVPTRYEVESFDPEASEMDLLDEVKQEKILAYLGLSYDLLFRPDAKTEPVLVTRREGGEPFATL